MRLNLRPWGGASRLLGTSWVEPEAWQWQPTRTAHDPNPPIPLEEPGVGYLTADAYLAGTAYGSFTTNAVLHDPSFPPTSTRILTADAAIRSTTPYFEDDFNRVVASGFGSTASDGSPYVDAGSAGSGTTSVDGGQLVVDNTGSFYTTGVYVPSVGVPSAATIEFDFYVGADPTQYVQYFLRLADGRHRFDCYVEQDTGGSWAFNSERIYQLFTPDASSWYTVRFAYAEGGGSAAKVWKRGTTEPDWQALDTNPNVLVATNSAQTNIFVENDGTDLAQLDNFRIYLSGGIVIGGSVTANAVQSKTIGDGTTSTPSFVGSSKAAGGGGMVSLAKPAGLAVGDLMVVVVRGPSVVTPEGWTLSPGAATYESYWIYVLTRVATAGDVAGSVFNIRTSGSTGFPSHAQLVAWRGASGIGLYQRNSVFGTTLPATATDTWVGVAGTAVQITWALTPSSATVTDPPDGMTLVEFEWGIATYYELYPVPGQLGTKAATWSGATTIQMLQLHIIGSGRFFTADAYFAPGTGQETHEGSVTADAWLTRTQVHLLPANAFIVRGGRTRHSADLHYGEMLDTVVTLSAAVGAAPQGSTLHDALVELESRISARESTGT